MQVYNFDQHSEDWYNIRLGKLTASHAKEISVGGAGLETLCFNLVGEILTKKKKETIKLINIYLKLNLSLSSKFIPVGPVSLGHLPPLEVYPEKPFRNSLNVLKSRFAHKLKSIFREFYFTWASD